MTSVSLVIFALLFVDDTDLIVINRPSGPQSLYNLTSRLQNLIHLWQGLLHASGGSLSADKCSWSLVAFKWNAGKWSYHTSRTFPASMFVRNSLLEEQTLIKRIEPHESITVVGVESITVVGVEQSLDGTMKGQLASLSKKIEKWANALCTNAVPRHIAWAAITSKIWPSLKFPLCSTTFTQQQSRYLMGKLYKHLLPRLGVNRSIAAAVRYGPIALAGLDLPDPYIYQGSQQVSLFLQLYGSPTNEGHLL